MSRSTEPVREFFKLLLHSLSIFRIGTLIFDNIILFSKDGFLYLVFPKIIQEQNNFVLFGSVWTSVAHTSTAVERCGGGGAIGTVKLNSRDNS